MVDDISYLEQQYYVKNMSSVDLAINYFLGYSGIISALVFSAWGAVYGSAKSGAGIYDLGTVKPHLILKSFPPIIMSGILAIYGLIVAVILSQKIPLSDYTSNDAYAHFSSGLCVGLACLGSGIGIGKIGYGGARAMIKEEKMFTGQILMLIFAQAFALYGLILSLLLASNDELID